MIDPTKIAGEISYCDSLAGICFVLVRWVLYVQFPFCKGNSFMMLQKAWKFTISPRVDHIVYLDF